MARSDWAPRRPDLQTPAEEESRYTSRVARSRKHLRLPTQKLERWEVWCTVQRKDFQQLVEEALDFYFYNLDAQAPSIRSDDLDRSMTLSSSRSSIGRPGACGAADDAEKHLLNFYCEATGNRLKSADKAVYRERLASLAPYIVKIGIITSVIRSKTRINSLNYCVGAIEEIAEVGTPENHLALMIRSVREVPMYADMLGPQRRENLLRAFALQPMLPGIGADVIPIGQEPE